MQQHRFSAGCTPGMRTLQRVSCAYSFSGEAMQLHATFVVHIAHSIIM